MKWKIEVGQLYTEVFKIINPKLPLNFLRSRLRFIFFAHFLFSRSIEKHDQFVYVTTQNSKLEKLNTLNSGRSWSCPIIDSMIFRYIVLVSVVAKIQHKIIRYLHQNPFCFNYFSLVLSRFWKSANDMAITCQGENLFSLFCPLSLFLCLRRHRRCRPNETNTFLSRTLSLPPNHRSKEDLPLDHRRQRPGGTIDETENDGNDRIGGLVSRIR